MPGFHALHEKKVLLHGLAWKSRSFNLGSDNVFEDIRSCGAVTLIGLQREFRMI
jgi:hypothetical protein